ncbi:GNAT family N-acetyltransferase [Frigidibacter mobilis]|uniref:MobC protein n=1 Tax=Frigidibacter mobilis TaxID=1335048 RepID=A0A159YYD6_9RHOB|nr:GNAT family N-acetyltransferase [Frigidibacter mobilis]AMY67411.1 MobC protein [Frigidibacter mobilis]
MSYQLRRGFDSARRAEAAALYWQAFGGKLGRVMGPEARALAYIAQVMRPDHAFSALSADGTVIGIAGFRSPYGSFVGGGSAELRGAYGRAGGTLRAGLLALLTRDIDNERFLVDGICVRADCRGQGIGRALLEALCNEGRARGYTQVRLDVVGENIRARALYERAGFTAAGQSRSRLTGVLFGFQTVTIMVRPL